MVLVKGRQYVCPNTMLMVLGLLLLLMMIVKGRQYVCPNTMRVTSSVHWQSSGLLLLLG
jgi:hypothetical protein